MVQSESPPISSLAIASDHELPVGAAHRAIRSPRSHAPLLNQDSFSSDKSALSSSGSCGSLDISVTGDVQPQDGHSGRDLAKRAQIRVTERKRNELEKKHEQEKLRVKKQESDKVKRDQQLQLKQRRRAEIYALNGILRQLQQEKMAAFISAHKRCDQHPERGGDSFAAECSEASLVQSIGV